VASELSPYFKFYPRDWLTRPDIITMSNEEQGAFLRLLCLQWIHGVIEHRQLKGMLGWTDEEIQKFLTGPVSECFELTEEGHLVNVNPELQGQRNKAVDLVEKRRACAYVRHNRNAELKAQGKEKPKKKQKHRNAVTELSEAVVDWERINGPMPERLRNAMSDYLGVRKVRRMPLWGREMWLRNLASSHTTREWADAYETAARCGWASVHPKSKTSVKPGSQIGGTNQFADLLNDEAGDQ